MSDSKVFPSIFGTGNEKTAELINAVHDYLMNEKHSLKMSDLEAEIHSLYEGMLYDEESNGEQFFGEEIDHKYLWKVAQYQVAKTIYDKITNK